MNAEIPYPAVFHDWHNHDLRVSTNIGRGGVVVDMLIDLDASLWQRVELTEEDACILAAALLRNAGRNKLSRKVLEKI